MSQNFTKKLSTNVNTISQRIIVSNSPGQDEWPFLEIDSDKNWELMWSDNDSPFYQNNSRQEEKDKMVSQCISQKNTDNIEVKKILKSINPKIKQKNIKNVNIPKYICRIYFHYLLQYKNQFQSCQSSYQVAQKRADQLRKWSSQSKNHYLSLQHLQQFFGDNHIKGMNPTLNRKVMRLIIKNHLKDQVMNNYQLLHKQSYLKTLKIYAIRCMNGQLTQRVQSK